MCVFFSSFLELQVISVQSDHSEESGSESEFEADPEELVASSSSNEESDYDDSDASGSDASGSDFGGGGDDSDEEGLCRLFCKFRLNLDRPVIFR